jgi:hypothetical protein
LKKLLILIAILLLGGIGYFTYMTWVKNANLTSWSFVPQNAIFVYESPNPIGTLEGIKETGIWKNLSSIPIFANSAANLESFDTLSGNGIFKNLFENTNTLISFHPVTSEDFDFLYIIDIDNLSKHAFVSGALAKYKNKGYNKKTREYLGFTITEYKDPKGSGDFTYIFYKNYFIGSFSAFLVEDAIRTVSNEEVASFDQKFIELQRVSKLEKDQGNVYFNFSRFPSLLNGMLKTNVTSAPAKSAFLDLQIADQYINMSGFTFLDEPTEFLSTLSQNPGSSIEMAEIIPNQTAWAYHFNLSDIPLFASKSESYFRISDNKVLIKRDELLAKNDFDVTFTYQLIDQEIGLITLEPSRPTRHDQYLFLEIKDMGEALRFFNSAGERQSATKGDTVYVEQFGNYEIRKLPISEFPYALLGDIALGFESTYYLQYRNYLIFSNNLLQLKNFTLAIENEDTWGKSLKIKKLLDQSNQAANFSLFINTPRAWNQVTSNLKDSWLDFAKEYQFPLRNLEFISLQFSAVDNKFYTNFTAHQPYIPSSTIPDKVNIRETIALPDFIITKPYLVTNHNTKKKEIVLQDSSYNLHQLSSEFSALWSTAINEKIITDILQIDYYKNGKLQIAFATKSGIHIIDRTGEYLPGFPKSIPGSRDIAFFTIIDYDNSKNYRFGIVDVKGAFYLTDKDLKPLTGWNPKTFDSPLTGPVEHYRIGRTDVIVAIQENGKINAMNRRGEFLEKFPINLDTNLEGGFFMKETNDLASSSIHLITQGGEIMELSLAGHLINREQFYKPSANTKFSFLTDISKESFVVVRKTERKCEVLSEDGNILFEKDYFTDKPLFTQYYKLGGGINYMVFVDPGGDYLYIYDMSGALVTGRPLSASLPISMIKIENEYLIYRCVDKNLELISLSF